MKTKKVFLIAAAAVSVFIISIIIWCCFNNNHGKTLVASGHLDWPPIMYRQNDAIVGAGPEIVNKIFSDLGVKVDSRYEGSWDQVQVKAKDGTVDVLVAAYKTADRLTYMDYSIPYTVDPVVLVVKKGKVFPYDKWEDLIGKRGVVTAGDSYGQDFDDFAKENLHPQTVTTPDEAFALLDQGKADYFVYALYSTEDYIAKHNAADKVEIIPKNVSSENFYVTISKKSPFIGLMPKVNELLEKYQNDGTIQKTIEKYKQSLWHMD